MASLEGTMAKAWAVGGLCGRQLLRSGSGWGGAVEPCELEYYRGKQGCESVRGTRSDGMDCWCGSG